MPSSSGRQARSRGPASTPRTQLRSSPRAVSPTPARKIEQGLSREKIGRLLDEQCVSLRYAIRIRSQRPCGLTEGSLVRVAQRMRHTRPAQSHLAVRYAGYSQSARNLFDELRQRGFCSIAGQGLATDLPETHIGVLGGELLSPHLERRTVESQRHVGKGEPRPIAADRMLSITTTENRPPVRSEAFGQVNRRNRHVVARAVRRGVEEPAGVFLRYVQTETTERRPFLRRRVRPLLDPLSRKSHAVRPRQSASPCTPPRTD